MKNAVWIIGLLGVIILGIGLIIYKKTSEMEFSVCVSNGMKVDAICEALMFDGVNCSVGSMGHGGGRGCIERIRGHKIPDVVSIVFSPLIKERDNESVTVNVDMKSIPRNTHGKIIFTIVDEKTVTVEYEPYAE